MNEDNTSKADLNPGESTNNKNDSSPRKYKRLSLAPDICLPKIAESGENRHNAFAGNNLNKGTEIANTDANDRTKKKQTGFCNANLDTKRTDPLVLDRVPNELSKSESVRIVRNDIMEDKEDKLNVLEEGDLNHKHDTKVEERNLKQLASVKSKNSAISSLAAEKSREFLNIFDRVKSVQRVKDSFETQPNYRCTHAKPNSMDHEKQPERCLICEISQAAEKLTSVDTNRFLVEILYPHDYYDKYSRSKRKLVGFDTSGSTPPVQMPIIKPAKVLRKQVVPRPVIQKENTNDVSEGTKLDIHLHTQENDSDQKLGKQNDANGPKSRLFGGHDKSAIHSKCGEGTQAMFIVEQSYTDRPLLKGLKGALRKEHSKGKPETCKIQSKYEVNSLGMRFALPDYNISLHNRKPSLARQTTSLPTHAQNTFSTLRPVTMFEERNHRALTLPRRLDRGLTFAGFEKNSQNMTLPFSSYERETTRLRQTINFVPVETTQTGLSPATAIKYTQTHRPFPMLKNKTHLTPIEHETTRTDFFLTSGTQV